MTFTETVANVNGVLNNIAWGWPTIILIFAAGLLLTIGSRFVQFSHFGHALKQTVGQIGKKQTAGKGAVTPLQAVCTALAATVGTGNITGVIGAICLGGPGAVFWMWVAALLGMATKYSEVVLAINYRERNEKGDWVGGPMYYIKNGMGKNWKWLGGVFCALGVLASFGIGNMTQAKNIATSITGAVQVFNADANADTVSLIVGIIIAVIVALISLGGIKRIGSVAEKIVPVMSVIYILASLTVIITNISSLGSVFGAIFHGAFNAKAVTGGALGVGIATIIKKGVARGIFSNEAGLGSAPMGHAAAETDHPVKQGMFGIFEVFMDTIVICTMTALTVLCSGVGMTWGSDNASIDIVTGAFASVFGGTVASVVLAVALSLFALTTILSWNLYGTRMCEFLLGPKAATVYKVLFLPVLVVGTTMSLDLVWAIADTLNGLMAIPNLIALVVLSPVVFKLTKDYFGKKKTEK